MLRKVAQVDEPALPSIRFLSVLPGGRRLEGRGIDRVARTWDTTTWACIAADTPPPARPSCTTATEGAPLVADFPNGWLAVGSGRRIYVCIPEFDPDNDDHMRELRPDRTLALVGHAAGLTALVVRPGGRLVSASWDGTIREWDVGWRRWDGFTTATCVGVTAVGGSAALALAALPDGRLVSAHGDRSIKVWAQAWEVRRHALAAYGAAAATAGREGET